jgi:hypothetical protein
VLNGTGISMADFPPLQVGTVLAQQAQHTGHYASCQIWDLLLNIYIKHQVDTPMRLIQKNRFMYYGSSKKQRAFEDKFGWNNILLGNEKIGKFLKFVPRIEYALCNNGSCCYSPSNIENFFPTADLQKKECERYLNEQKEKCPNGMIVSGGFITTKIEHFPNFHIDWNHLIEAISRFRKTENGEKLFVFYDDIFLTWELILKAIENVIV